MAVLHEYVSSSDKEGYYIYDAYDGANVTYQVSSLAHGIFDKLDSCKVDEQLPGEVFHTLHRLGLIYTHQSGVEQPEQLAEIPSSGPSKSLSTSERRTFFNELLLSNSLEIEQQQEIQEYVDSVGLETECGSDLHGNWMPSPPDDEVHQGKVTSTFQDGAWGFISSDQIDLGEDIFFHINELDGMTLLPGMSVEFTYDETTEGYQAFYVRRLTDALGRDLEEETEHNESDLEEETKSYKYDVEAESKHNEPNQNPPRDGDTVGISDLSEGDYIEARIDRRKGQRGLGQKGYLHIHHRRESSDGYLHIATRDDFIPVNEWVEVQITAIRKGHAEATIRSAPSDIEPPIYLPNGN